MNIGFHILLIDDDVEAVARMTSWLIEVGYQVTHAATFAEGEAMIDELAPDLVLLDVLMPKLHSKQVEAFLQLYPASATPPVVLRTPTHPAVLMRMLNTSNALGVMEANIGEDRFLAALRNFTRWLEMRNLLRRPPAGSGMHRVFPMAATYSEDETTTERTGSGR